MSRLDISNPRGYIIVSNREHPSKAVLFTELIDFGSIIEIKFVQSLNAHQPIFVTEFEILMEVKFEHSLKAHCFMEVTELGMFTDVKLLILKHCLYIQKMLLKRLYNG